MDKVRKALREGQPFTDDLVESIVASNDTPTFLLALERDDCPAALLVDIASSPNDNVRCAVAKHANTPAATLARLSRDHSRAVASAARSR